jgi:predicted ATP-dependent endonuclease of OLD family
MLLELVMKLISYRVYMYKSVLDSGWIEVSPLTVLVGKNESGKTSLLKALHKLNPFRPEPYSLEREWPRSRRTTRNPDQVVCRAKFQLSAQELNDLNALAEEPLKVEELEVTRNYRGQLEVDFPKGLFLESLRPNQVEEACMHLPNIVEPVNSDFKEIALKLRDEVQRLAAETRFNELPLLQNKHHELLQQQINLNSSQPHYSNETTYTNQYYSALGEMLPKLSLLPIRLKQAHEYVVHRLPTFIYMDEYRAFTGTALLDQVLQRKLQGRLTEEDRSLLTIMELSGLNLEQEVDKGLLPDKEERQYDLDDAAATLTKEIEGRWKQRKYQVQFRGDGHQFFTFVRDEKDPALIKLEERSKGFQWFFSFDLLFMHESKGEFRNCVLLLDEPGLHLHPNAQKDLLARLEHYADENTLIYTTHMPFMIDLRRPERLRAVSETEGLGTVVSEDLTSTQPEAKLTLQAALGMSGSSSYLLSKRNIVVEGVDDYWILTELSNLLIRSGSQGLPEDVMITAAGGASEAAYIATLMIGQELDVVVLLDSDTAGDAARDRLIKNWLAHYRSNHCEILSLGKAAGYSNQEFSIEDMFEEKFYLDLVKATYSKEIALTGKSLTIQGNGQLCKQVARALETIGISFNKGRVAKPLRKALTKATDLKDIGAVTKKKTEALVSAIISALPPLPS